MSERKESSKQEIEQARRFTKEQLGQTLEELAKDKKARNAKLDALRDHLDAIESAGGRGVEIRST